MACRACDGEGKKRGPCRVIAYFYDSFAVWRRFEPKCGPGAPRVPCSAVECTPATWSACSCACGSATPAAKNPTTSQSGTTRNNQSNQERVIIPSCLVASVSWFFFRNNKFTVWVLFSFFCCFFVSCVLFVCVCVGVRVHNWLALDFVPVVIQLFAIITEHYNPSPRTALPFSSHCCTLILRSDFQTRSLSFFFPFSFSFYLRFCTQFLASWSEIPSLRAAVLDSMCAAVRRGEERSDRSSRSPFWMSNIRTGFRAIRSTKEPLLDRGNCTTGHLCRAQNSRCAKWIPSFECRLIMSAPLPHSPL